jgi:hypothetical protein
VIEMTFLDPAIGASGPVSSATEIRETLPAMTGRVAQTFGEAYCRFHPNRACAPGFSNPEPATGAET